MKILSRIWDSILYIIVIITLTSSIGAVITKKPFLMTAVRSNSMYPVFQRGDILLIKPVLQNSHLNIGDIIIFDPEEGSMASKGVIAHRIYDGDEVNGFITKGDANDDIDQRLKGDVLIKKEWISNQVIKVGSAPIKIPLLGYLSIWMENYQKGPYLIPTIIIILAIIIGIGEMTNNKKKKVKKNKLEMQLIYFFSGLVIVAMLGMSMLAMSQHLILDYEVSETNKGVLLGSDIGIILVGESVEKPLSELNNNGIFPMISTYTTNDSQITFNKNIVFLSPGQNFKTTYKVEAKKLGKYKSRIDIGVFIPLLPKSIIYFLAKQNYWLALIVTSLIPGLPVMMYPFMNSKLRRKTFKEVRRKFRKIKGLISLN